MLVPRQKLKIIDMAKRLKKRQPEVRGYPVIRTLIVISDAAVQADGHRVRHRPAGNMSGQRTTDIPG